MRRSSRTRQCRRAGFIGQRLGLDAVLGKPTFYTGGHDHTADGEVEEDLATRVATAAAERGIAPESGFVSLGSFTTGRRADEGEEMLAEGFGR